MLCLNLKNQSDFKIAVSASLQRLGLSGKLVLLLLNNNQKIGSFELSVMLNVNYCVKDSNGPLKSSSAVSEL